MATNVQFEEKLGDLAKNLIILCGHFKGIDYRIREHLITKEISIGDQSLEVARQANAQLAKLKEESDALIAAANKEQGRIMREAMHERDKIIVEARKHAEALA